MQLINNVIRGPTFKSSKCCYVRSLALESQCRNCKDFFFFFSNATHGSDISDPDDLKFKGLYSDCIGYKSNVALIFGKLQQFHSLPMK